MRVRVRVLFESTCLQHICNMRARALYAGENARTRPTDAASAGQQPVADGERWAQEKARRREADMCMLSFTCMLT
jgi:hypothetical protein